MNKAHVEYLKSAYNDAVNDYCRQFCLKHEWEYNPDDWTGGRVGEVLCVTDELFVDFRDIKADIDNDFPVETYMKWYWYVDELMMLGCKKLVNYESFAKGCPLPYSEEQLDAIRIAAKRTEEAKKALYDCLAATAEGCDFVNGDAVCGNCRNSIPQTDGNYHRCTLHRTFHKYYDNPCHDWLKGVTNEQA